MASSGQTTVTSTAILIIEAYGEFRDVHLRNIGSHTMYAGGSNVSTSNGFAIPKDSYINFRVAPKSQVWAVTANNDVGVASVLYMEP
jgi:hypothetical protein